MSTIPAIEDRLTAVERAIEELRQQLARKQTDNWLDHFIGTFENEPAFEEVVRLGREYRQSDRQPDDHST